MSEDLKLRAWLHNKREELKRYPDEDEELFANDIEQLFIDRNKWRGIAERLVSAVNNLSNYAHVKESDPDELGKVLSDFEKAKSGEGE